MKLLMYFSLLSTNPDCITFVKLGNKDYLVKGEVVKGHERRKVEIDVVERRGFSRETFNCVHLIRSLLPNYNIATSVQFPEYTNSKELNRPATTFTQGFLR